jgi:hypothetical protein
MKSMVSVRPTLIIFGSFFFQPGGLSWSAWAIIVGAGGRLAISRSLSLLLVIEFELDLVAGYL